MSIYTRIKALIQIDDDGDHAEVFDASAGRHEIDYLLEMADGTGASQCDLVFSDQRTLSASANEDIDLSGGFNDAYGTSVVLVTLKVLIVHNTNTTDDDDIQIGPASSNGCDCFFADTSDRVIVPAGGIAIFVARYTGYTVAAGTADLLNVEEIGGANANTYKILVAGTSS